MVTVEIKMVRYWDVFELRTFPSPFLWYNRIEREKRIGARKMLHSKSSISLHTILSCSDFYILSRCENYSFQFHKKKPNWYFK